jgi:hypothetical protein
LKDYELKKFLFLIIFTLTALVVCIKQPKFQTEITIPLLSQNLKIREILDSNYFRINPDSSMDLFYQARIDTFHVNDSLKIFELRDTLHLALNDFFINNLVNSSINLTLADITGFNLPDTTLPVLPFDTTLFEQELYLSGIEQIDVIEVIMILEVSNFTQLSFDTVNLNLHDIGNFSFASIGAGQTVTKREKLQNINLADSIILFDIGISSPGSPLPIPVSRYDSLMINLSFDSLRINSGLFRVPINGMQATRTGNCLIPSNYRIHIDTITFLSGILNLTIQNKLPCPIQTSIHINELGFDSLVELPAGMFNEIVLDFSGRSYINQNPDSTIMSCSTEVIIQPTAQPIEFRPAEFLSVSYLFTEPQILRFIGSIYDTITSQIKPKIINLNLPQGLGHVNIQNAELEASITSALEFPVLFYLRLESNNDLGEQVVIDTLLEIQPGSPSLPRTTPLLMEITELINIVPRNINITGFRGVTGTGRAEAESYITGAYSFMSPLRLAFDSSTINFNPQQVAITDKQRENIERYLVSATITAHYINHFPFGVSGVLKLESVNTDTVFVPFRVIEPMVDKRTGIVLSSVDTIITIDLDENEMNVFKQNQIFATALLFLPKTDTVSVTARDYFSIDYSIGKLKLNLLK